MGKVDDLRAMREAKHGAPAKKVAEKPVENRCTFHSIGKKHCILPSKHDGGHKYK